MDDVWLTYETFAALLGAQFIARVDGTDGVALTLVEANDSGAPGGVGADGRTRTQFSVTFRGPADVPIDQGTYPMAAEGLAEQLIFLVPVRADADGRDYEAVFA